MCASGSDTDGMGGDKRADSRLVDKTDGPSELHKTEETNNGTSIKEKEREKKNKISEKKEERKDEK